MPIEKCKKSFHGKEGYNCAQAIAAGFNYSSSIEEFKKYGGGKAKDGLCGALFAAEIIASDQDKAARIRKEFREIVGGISCREIKSTLKIPCTSCVEIAARILKEEMVAL